VLTDNKAFLTNYLILVLSGNNDLHVHNLLNLPKLELKDNKHQNFGDITELFALLLELLLYNHLSERAFLLDLKLAQMLFL
jgi:hypothetical protein